MSFWYVREKRPNDEHGFEKRRRRRRRRRRRKKNECEGKRSFSASSSCDSVLSFSPSDDLCDDHEISLPYVHFHPFGHRREEWWGCKIDYVENHHQIRRRMEERMIRRERERENSSSCVVILLSILLLLPYCSLSLSSPDLYTNHWLAFTLNTLNNRRFGRRGS